MKSESMRRVYDRLVSKLGEGYGRIKFMWLCQRYDVMPWDECPASMAEWNIRLN